MKQITMIEANTTGRDDVGICFTIITDTPVDAAKLLHELTSVLPPTTPVVETQTWHLATAELSYGGGAVVQVRFKYGQPPLNVEAKESLKDAVKNHKV